MSELDEMKNKANQGGQNMQDQMHDHMHDGEDTDEAAPAQDKSGSPMQGVKKKMDRDGDGDFDKDDAKKVGEDAVNKVKGLFKKD